MRNLISALAFLCVAACGGGSSTPSTPVTPPLPPPVSDADPGGLWFGLLTNDDQTFEELVAITTSDGRFAFISLDTFGPDTIGQYFGTATVVGADVTGTGSAYASFGSTWSDGSVVHEITLAGILSERSSMSGTWVNSSGETVVYELDYDALHEKDSSLALLEGVWFVYDDTLNPTLTMTIDAAGAFSAQASSGCQSLGQVSIIDAQNNVYGWDVAISGIGCPVAGDYSGLAFLADVDTGDPNNSQDNAILVSMSNDQRAILLALER
jgi:hypothetical protein